MVYQNKHKLYNPIWQNTGHIYALQRLLGLEKRHFHNIVVFSGEAQFKTEMPAKVHGINSLTLEIYQKKPVLLSLLKEVDKALFKLDTEKLENNYET